jgi:hypothetical protein
MPGFDRQVCRMMPNVILKLCDQGQDAHHELSGAGVGVDSRTINDLEPNSLLCKEIRREAFA